VDYVRQWSPDISTIFRQPLLNSPAFLRQLSRSLTFLCFLDNITKLHDNLPVGKFSENLPTHTKTNSKQSTASCYAKKKPQSQWRRMNLRLQWACQTWGHQGSTSQRLCCGHCGSRSPGPWQHNTANLAHSRKQKINLMPKLLISFDVSFRLYAICINYQLCLWQRWHQNRSGSANDKHTTKFLLTIQ